MPHLRVHLAFCVVVGNNSYKEKSAHWPSHSAWSKADLHILVPRAQRSRILTEQGGTTHMKVGTRHTPALCRTRSKRTINTRTDIDICSLSQLTKHQILYR